MGYHRELSNDMEGTSDRMMGKISEKFCINENYETNQIAIPEAVQEDESSEQLHCYKKVGSINVTEKR